MAVKQKVSDEVLAVLRRSDVTATSVKLPEQLDRKLYVAVDKVLKGAGGKWNRSAGVHIFARDPREDLGLVIESGVSVNRQQLFQSFYTPDSLADQVVELACIEYGNMVLEPSIGGGALAMAVRRAQPDTKIHGYDVDKEALAKLAETDWFLSAKDFLTIDPRNEHKYNVIVMNPPFSGLQDIDHVMHAYNFLAPGGRLVAIMTPTSLTGQTKKHAAFRRLFDGCGGSSENVPEGAFKDSGTNVRTIIVKLQAL